MSQSTAFVNSFFERYFERFCGSEACSSGDFESLCGSETAWHLSNIFEHIKKHNFNNFGRTLAPSNRSKFFIYYQNNEIVAFTKMQFYPIPMQTGYQVRPYKGIETYMFAWDYANPELRLGEVTLQHEIAWAKKYKNPNGGGGQGYEYLYTGPGYERSSIYKADVDGFEWWTGMEWSKDVKKYKQLCRRDSKIRSFKAMEKLWDTT